MEVLQELKQKFVNEINKTTEGTEEFEILKELFLSLRQVAQFFNYSIVKDWYAEASCQQISMEYELWKKQIEEIENIDGFPKEKIKSFLNIALFKLVRETTEDFTRSFSFGEVKDKLQKVLQGWITLEDMNYLKERIRTKILSEYNQHQHLQNSSIIFGKEGLLIAQLFKNEAKLAESRESIIRFVNSPVETAALKRLFWPYLLHEKSYHICSVAMIGKSYGMVPTMQLDRISEFWSIPISEEWKKPITPVVFIGETGTGKSTLLKLMTGYNISVAAAGQTVSTTSGINVMPVKTSDDLPFQYAFIDTEGYNAGNALLSNTSNNMNGGNSNDGGGMERGEFNSNQEVSSAASLLSQWNLRFAYATASLIVNICSYSDLQRHSFRTILEALRATTSGIIMTQKPDLLIVFNKVPKELKTAIDFEKLLKEQYEDPETGKWRSYLESFEEYFETISHFVIVNNPLQSNYERKVAIIQKKISKTYLRNNVVITDDQLRIEVETKISKKQSRFSKSITKLRALIDSLSYHQYVDRVESATLYFRSGKTFCEWFNYAISNFTAPILDVKLWGQSSTLNKTSSMTTRVVTFFSIFWSSLFTQQEYYPNDFKKEMIKSFSQAMEYTIQVASLIAAVYWRQTNPDLTLKLPKSKIIPLIEKSRAILFFNTFIDNLEQSVLPCTSFKKISSTQYIHCSYTAANHPPSHHANTLLNKQHKSTKWSGKFEASNHLLTADLILSLKTRYFDLIADLILQSGIDSSTKVKSILQILDHFSNKAYSPEICTLCGESIGNCFKNRFSNAPLCRECAAALGFAPRPSNLLSIAENQNSVPNEHVGDLLAAIYSSEIYQLRVIEEKVFELVSMFTSSFEKTLQSSPPLSNSDLQMEKTLWTVCNAPKILAIMDMISSFTVYSSITENFDLHTVLGDLAIIADLDSMIRLCVNDFSRVMNDLQDPEIFKIASMNDLKTKFEPIFFAISSVDYSRNSTFWGLGLEELEDTCFVPGTHLPLIVDHLLQQLYSLSFEFSSLLYGWLLCNKLIHIKLSQDYGLHEITACDDGHLLIFYLLLYLKDLPEPLVPIIKIVKEDQNLHRKITSTFSSANQQSQNQRSRSASPLTTDRSAEIEIFSTIINKLNDASKAILFALFDFIQSFSDSKSDLLSFCTYFGEAIFGTHALQFYSPKALFNFMYQFLIFYDEDLPDDLLRQKQLQMQQQQSLHDQLNNSSSSSSSPSSSDHQQQSSTNQNKNAKSKRSSSSKSKTITIATGGSTEKGTPLLKSSYSTSSENVGVRSKVKSKLKRHLSSEPISRNPANQNSNSDNDDEEDRSIRSQSKITKPPQAAAQKIMFLYSKASHSLIYSTDGTIVTRTLRPIGRLADSMKFEFIPVNNNNNNNNNAEKMAVRYFHIRSVLYSTYLSYSMTDNKRPQIRLSAEPCTWTCSPGFYKGLRVAVQLRDGTILYLSSRDASETELIAFSKSARIHESWRILPINQFDPSLFQ